LKDHGFYILMSYGVFACVVLIELYALRRHRRRAIEEARQMEEGLHMKADGNPNAKARHPS
jgi:heme exporter protein CcmD